ncbi:hypothetical protein [Pseudosulfitobacter pseudonitzschiae]|uniref:hypothetical protein n=1 Tax=Pseudosulfitobacter pseudonitzschiae TaxID=1402135 RepID=UPI001CD2ED83|nr:hypothetical protein [Pseudosulfitobacter pseudonitzschiae]
MIRGEIALREMAGSGHSGGQRRKRLCQRLDRFKLAVDFLKAGNGDCCLAVGAEKMYSDDRALMFSAFDSGWMSAMAKKSRGVWPIWAPGSRNRRVEIAQALQRVHGCLCRFARLHMKTFARRRNSSRPSLPRTTRIPRIIRWHNTAMR